MLSVSDADMMKDGMKASVLWAQVHKAIDQQTNSDHITIST